MLAFGAVVNFPTRSSYPKARPCDRDRECIKTQEVTMAHNEAQPITYKTQIKLVSEPCHFGNTHEDGEDCPQCAYENELAAGEYLKDSLEGR